jgi:hypothetical protein
VRLPDGDGRADPVHDAGQVGDREMAPGRLGSDPASRAGLPGAAGVTQTLHDDAAKATAAAAARSGADLAYRPLGELAGG